MEREMYVEETIRIQNRHGSFGSLVSIDLNHAKDSVLMASHLIAGYRNDDKKVIVFTLGNTDVSDLIGEVEERVDSMVTGGSVIVNTESHPYYERVFTEIGSEYNAVILGTDTRYLNDEQRTQHLLRLKLLVQRFHIDVVVFNNSSESESVNDCTTEYYSYFGKDMIEDLHNRLDEYVWGCDYDQSIDLALELSMNDDPEGAYILGLHMLNGWSYPVDRYGAADSFRDALLFSDSDFLEPLLLLHDLYKDESFTDRSEELAVHYLLRAAILGDRSSMMKLAEWYESKAYIEEAIYWYRAAGQRYRDGALLYKAAELLIENDLDSGLAWGILIPRAAEYGYYPAIKCYALALAGKKSTGGCVGVDLQKSVSVMQTLMDSREYESAADVIEDAITCIEIVQSQSDTVCDD